MGFRDQWKRWLTHRGIAIPPPDGLGPQGELLAVRFLRRQQMKILAVRESIGNGELDIVARDHGTIVFVEVKTRRSPDMRDALAAVDSRKQAQLRRLAEIYLTRHRLHSKPARFDVVGIAWPHNAEPQIQHVINAFGSCDGVAG